VSDHPARSWPRIVTRSIAIAAAVGVGLLVGADVFADGDAAGHVRYHASIALVVLAMAILPARRAEGSARAMAPAIGLWLFAAAQLVEAVGGAGFDAANETRNGIAWIHDLGLGLTALGLVAAVVGIAVGIRDALARRGVPRGIAFGGGAAVVGVGLFVVKTLIGF
jgi:hypothetical protein